MRSSIKKNYIYNLSYQVFTLLIPLIVTPYVSRVLHPDGVGFFSYANSVATYFALAAALGLASYGMREVALVKGDIEKASKIFYELTIVRIITTTASLAVYAAFVFIFTDEWEYYFAVGLTIAAVFFDCNWFFQALENFKMLALRNFVVKTATVILIFTFVKTQDDLLLYFLIQSGGVLAANALVLPALKAHLVKVPFKSLKFRHHISETIVYFIPTIATSIYTVLDKTMIGVITGNMFENGFYEQAHRIVHMLLTVVTSLTIVVGVRTSSLFADNNIEAIKNHIRKTFRYVCMIALPMTAGLMACAGIFVPWFFGEGFDKTAPLLVMFSPLIFIISISNVVGTVYLTPTGQRKRSNKAIIAGAILNFVLNIILIPLFNTYGAVIASICAELLISCMYLYFGKDYISVRDIAKDSFKYLIMATVMGVAIYFIGKLLPVTVTSSVIQIGAGILIYFAGLLILRDGMLIDTLKRVIAKFKRS